MTPQGAIFEADLGGVAVWNVAALLPTRDGGYPERPLDAISHLFVHHSGSLGRPGFEGLLASTRYCVTQKRRNSRGDIGFPGCPYHIWLPHNDERDSEGRLVVYRSNPAQARCWHTGGPLNGFGESLVLQGNTTSIGMSPTQIECLEAVLPWRFDALTRPQFGVPVLSWHSEASRSGGRDKAACPGSETVAWLSEYRASSGWAQPSE